MSQLLTPPVLSNIDLSQFDARYIDGDWDKQAAARQMKANTKAARDLA